MSPNHLFYIRKKGQLSALFLIKLAVVITFSLYYLY